MMIKINDLRAVFDMVLKHLEKKGIQSFELENDYYWEISKEELYDPSQEPQDSSLGQLYEDWEFLGNILKGEVEPIGFALVWMSSILRYLGEKYVD